MTFSKTCPKWCHAGLRASPNLSPNRLCPMPHLLGGLLVDTEHTLVYTPVNVKTVSPTFVGAVATLSQRWQRERTRHTHCRAPCFLACQSPAAPRAPCRDGTETFATARARRSPPSPSRPSQ